MALCAFILNNQTYFCSMDDKTGNTVGETQNNIQGPKYHSDFVDLFYQTKQKNSI